MRIVRHNPSVACCLVAGLTVAAGTDFAAGASYRWTDEDGHVHYGDTMPADAADAERSRLDASGREINTVGESIREVEETVEEEAEGDASEDRQAQRDRRLLRMFPNERELIRSRDQHLEAVQAQIDWIEGQIRQLEDHHQKLVDLRADTESQQRRAELDSKIEAIDERIERQESSLKKKHLRHARIKAKFDADLQRLRELLHERAAQ